MPTAEVELRACRDNLGRIDLILTYIVVPFDVIGKAGLRDAGKLPLAKLSSDALFAHFGIEVAPEARHTALGDALATFELYGKLTELFR